LVAIRWPTPINNRLAYGIATLSWGGKNAQDLQPWALGVADFPKTDPEEFENFVTPADTKLEARPHEPTSVYVWRVRCLGEIAAFASVMGIEHKQEREKCMETLLASHEANKHTYPLSWVKDVWEEINGVWCEEIREKRRQLCRMLGTDNPRKEEVRFLALAPGPTGAASWVYPDSFDLESPTGHYQRVIVPRMQRKLENYLHAAIHAKPKAPPPKGAGPRTVQRVGAAEEVRPAVENAQEAKAGGGGGGARAPGVGGRAVAPAKSPKLYPAGKRLPPHEMKASLQHQPKTAEGKAICWDAACWSGCPLGDKCRHSHAAIKGYGGLHWTVVARLVRQRREGPGRRG